MPLNYPQKHSGAFRAVYSLLFAQCSFGCSQTKQCLTGFMQHHGATRDANAGQNGLMVAGGAHLAVPSLPAACLTPNITNCLSSSP